MQEVYSVLCNTPCQDYLITKTWLAVIVHVEEILSWSWWAKPEVTRHNGAGWLDVTSVTLKADSNKRSLVSDGKQHSIQPFPANIGLSSISGRFRF